MVITKQKAGRLMKQCGRNSEPEKVVISFLIKKEDIKIREANCVMKSEHFILVSGVDTQLNLREH